MEPKIIKGEPMKNVAWTEERLTQEREKLVKELQPLRDAFEKSRTDLLTHLANLVIEERQRADAAESTSRDVSEKYSKLLNVFKEVSTEEETPKDTKVKKEK